MFSHLAIIFMGISCSICYSNYDMFEGFDRHSMKLDTVDSTTEQTALTNQTNSVSENTKNTVQSLKDNSANPTIFSAYSTPKTKKKPKPTCPEERPTNLGSYEVPTEKDIVIFTKDLLLSMFEAYEGDAMAFLMDIKEATRAAATVEKKCPHNKQAYKQCIKRVSGQSESVTKSLVSSLQLEKINVTALIDNAICSLKEMKSDPMSLIKLLAQETVMLKFALPAFLRLLNSCFELCAKSPTTTYAKKPLHRMTDQELVVKNFLTNNN